MIDLEFMEGLIRALDASGLDSVEIERGGTRVRVSKSGGFVAQPVSYSPAPIAAPMPQPAAPPAASPASPNPSSAPAPEAPAAEEAASEGLVEVKSPMVGTFYRSPSPDADPFVAVGDRIAVGDTICIIEAMKLMNELEAELEGRIVEVCVENAEPVEYGQLLFRVAPA